jgi:hypothetical protein
VPFEIPFDRDAHRYEIQLGDENSFAEKCAVGDMTKMAISNRELKLREESKLIILLLSQGSVIIAT